ncbi:MAG: hypothetical protein HY925_00990, partial [Elusimicrobia bacterium]|nr:hypothetical protein [Elusimicrobiota bacterium]
MPAGSRGNPLEHLPEFEEVGPRPKRWPAVVAVLGLFGLLAFQGWILGVWIGGEDRPPSWDQAIHLEIAHDYAVSISKGDWGGVLRLGPKPGMPPFPPAYELTLLPWLGRPDAAMATLWANFGWLSFLILVVFALGWLYAGPFEALAACVLLSCAPQTQWLVRNHLSDLALAAWVASAYLAVAWSAGFLRWKGSLLAGLAVGGALLTKWSAWTYFLPLGLLLLRATGNQLTRWRALSALGVAVALCVPWYAAQAPVLLPRLVDATADQAVPVWHGWAIFSYLRILLGGLDTPFWALALVSAVVPRLKRAREDNWLVVGWFAAAFVFWTIVPNRQMRFLYPAIAPLALFVPGVFPKSSVALCLWMLASAANFTLAKVEAFSFGPGLLFFTQDPPKKQDWKLGEILRAADELRDRELPFSNMAVLANDERFNGASFNWERKRIGTLDIAIRGINSRYCELAEFVIVKGGRLGPASVVNQLPEVREYMLRDGSWFLDGYAAERRFGLADGTEATLYRRKRRASPPWKQPALKIASLETPQFTAKELALKFGKWDPAAGVYDFAELSAALLVVRGLEIENVKARLEGVDLVPLKGPDGLADVRLLRLRKLTLQSARVKAESLAAFAGKRAKLGEPSARLEDTVAVSGRLKGKLPVSA